MKLLLNGRLMDERAARISVFDRGFLYGDGLFETTVCWNRQPFRWEQHWQRLQAGAAVLRLRLPGSAAAMLSQAQRLLAANRQAKGILRLAISRGIGRRGYSPKGAHRPTWVMTLHPLPRIQPGRPERWTLHTASLRLSRRDPLSRFKTANRLLQIVARMEAGAAGADEALLLNDRGAVAEAATSNLFWLKDRVLATPPLRAGGLPGITRTVLMEIAKRLSLIPREVNLAGSELMRQDAVFLSLSTLGIVEIIALDGRRLKRSPLVKALHAAYWQEVRETMKTEVRELISKL